MALGPEIQARLNQAPYSSGHAESLVTICATHLVPDRIAVSLLKTPVIGLCDLCAKIIRSIFIFIDDFRIGDIKVSLADIAAVDQVDGMNSRTNVIGQVELRVVDKADSWVLFQELIKLLFLVPANNCDVRDTLTMSSGISAAYAWAFEVG